MKRHLTRVVFLLVISSLIVGCRKDEQLEVGFARAPMHWRVGVKPGQVGTEALPEQTQAMTSMLQDILETLLDEDYDREWLIYDLTAWTLEKLEERVDAVEPGKYAFFFEDGHGVELPPDAKAVVLRSGDQKVALVRADIFLMHEHIQTRVADLIHEETGIERDAIFLAGTHNHSAPHAISPAAGVWSLADAFDPRHFVYVTRAIADAIIEADRNLEPAVMRAHRTSYSEVQQNIIGPREEELLPPDGDEPVVVEVGYPRDYFDDELAVLRFESPGQQGEDGEMISGDHLATVFVFGMHPETLDNHHGITSGEWPLHVEHRLTSEHGGFWMWLPGSLGDCEPDRGRANPDHIFWREGFDAMDIMSDMIGSAVSDAWEDTGSVEAHATPKLDYMARDISGPPDHPMPDSTYLGGFLTPMVRLMNDKTTFPLHLVRLGDVLLIGVPAETVSDLSFNIKSRIGEGWDEVYQGYVFDSAPDWVRARIGQNFKTSTVPEEMRVPMPLVTNMTGGYMGYIVTRWEFENREHYRQSLTTYGPGTAERVAGSLVGMTRELLGGEPFEVEPSPWQRADDRGYAEIADYLASLDEVVTEMSGDNPPSDPDRVGTVLSIPADGHPGDEPIEVTWAGGTNDMPPPSVTIEAEVEGEWTEVAAGPSGDVWVLFEAPDEWTAWWRTQSVRETTTVRVRAEGWYRGDEPGVTRPDELFDPDGANQSYSLTTEPFVLE